MKRRHVWIGAWLSIALLMVGCSQLSPAAFDVSAGFNPTALGFEVDDEGGGIEVAAHTVTFVSGPGSVGAVVTGYEAQYVDSAGVPIVDGSAGLVGEDFLGHVVPPGYVCAETVPCTVLASDVSVQRQVSEPLENVITLPGVVAIEIVNRNAVAARAEGAFFLTTDNGRDVELPFVVPVTYPVAP